MPENSIFDVHKEPGMIVINFNSTMENIDSVAEEVKLLMGGKGLQKHSFGVRIVMREGLTNAVRHGNKNDPEKLVRFEINIKDNCLTMIIEDQGEGFNWKKVKDDCCPEKEALIPLDHGRGVPIIDEYFDSYCYNEKGNILTLIKDISS